MKRQIIISFIFTFFLSTTGLPFALHYCGMQGSISLSSCEMCEVEEAENENSCCQAEYDFSVQLKSDNSDECCETKIVDSSIKDDFVKAISETKIDSKNLESSLISSEDNSLSFLLRIIYILAILLPRYLRIKFILSIQSFLFSHL